MKNHEARFTGSAPFPEVNVAKYDKFEKGNNFCGRGRSHDRGQKNYYNHDGHRNRNKQETNKGSQDSSSNIKDDIYYRYDMKGHYCSHVCHTPEYFGKLYQTSIKKGKILKLI